MYKHQQQVKEFHEKMQLLINDKPTIPSEEVLKLRCKLLLEEVLEFCSAAGMHVIVTNQAQTYEGNFEKEKPLMKGCPQEFIYIERDNDRNISLVEMADALADIQYVNDGAAVSLGIDLEPINNEVHRSNMSKLWSLENIGSIRTGMNPIRVGENQWIIKDSHGKVIKSPSYSPADIRSELIKQGASEL